MANGEYQYTREKFRMFQHKNLVKACMLPPPKVNDSHWLFLNFSRKRRKWMHARSIILRRKWYGLKACMFSLPKEYAASLGPKVVCEVGLESQEKYIFQLF